MSIRVGPGRELLPPGYAPCPGPSSHAALVDTVRAALVEARDRRSLTTRDLAARTGYAPTSIRRVLHGRGWSLPLVLRLVRVLRPTLPEWAAIALDAATVVVAPRPVSGPPQGSAGWRAGTGHVAHLTPFGELLDPRWLTLERPERCTTILLHEALGAWVECDTDVLRDLTREEAALLVGALATATQPGQHVIESGRAGSSGWARCVRISPDRPATTTWSVSLSSSFQGRSGPGNGGGHRWLEVSVACPECAEQVEVYTGAPQGDDELDEQVYGHPGDLYLCGDGHVGSIVVQPSERAAYLGEPALADQTRESAETLAREPGPVARHLRAPIRGVAS